MRYQWRNPAYILRLVRDGVVKSWDDLCSHFGIPPKERVGTLVSMLRMALDDLHEAKLIECSESYGSLKVTPLVEQIQRTLSLSISELASTTPHSRMLVSPLFGTSQSEKYKSDVFVLMPFSQALAPLYQDHLKAVAASLGMTIARADDFFTTAEIMTEVWAAISSAKLLIADCTGRNPNVFYEIGLAHAIGKPVVLITQNQDDVPFDLRHRRYIQYEFTPRGMKTFEDSLTKTLRSILGENDDA